MALGEGGKGRKVGREVGYGRKVGWGQMGAVSILGYRAGKGGGCRGQLSPVVPPTKPTVLSHVPCPPVHCPCPVLLSCPVPVLA